MKPCNCKSMADIEKLDTQGIAFNNKKIMIDSSGIVLEIEPYVRIKIDHINFKRFAEWYLKDQKVGYLKGDESL